MEKFNLKMKLLIFPIIFTFLPIFADALSYDKIEERYQCDAFPVQSGINSSWLESVSKWYVPLLNKVELYHNAESVYGQEKFAQLSTKDLDLSCPTYKDEGSVVTFTSFTDKQVIYKVYEDPLREGIYYWSNPSSQNKEYLATSYTTLSDNSSYVVTICLYKDGRKGFTVGSVKESLDNQTIYKIRGHLKSLGFNRRHIVHTGPKCYNNITSSTPAK